MNNLQETDNAPADIVKELDKAKSAKPADEIKALSPLGQIKYYVNYGDIKKRFEQVLGKNTNMFLASIVELFKADSYLQQCVPLEIINECFRAALVNLPINKELGYAYIIPRKNYDKVQKIKRLMPCMEYGVYGWVQVTLRTGLIKYINSGVVYDGELISHDKLTGEIDINGERTSDKIIGYFAFFETLRGHRKCLFKTKEELEKHREYSDAWKYAEEKNKYNSIWHIHFDLMARKTLLKEILKKDAPKSIETIYSYEVSQYNTSYEEPQIEIKKNIVIDTDSENIEPENVGEIIEKGPNFIKYSGDKEPEPVEVPCPF